MEKGNEWKIGTTCSKCGKGRYWPTGKRGTTEKPETGETQNYIELECDRCNSKLHQSVLGEKIQVSDSLEVEK